jgi:hypothetical protein
VAHQLREMLEVSAYWRHTQFVFASTCNLNPLLDYCYALGVANIRLNTLCFPMEVIPHDSWVKDDMPLR